MEQLVANATDWVVRTTSTPSPLMVSIWGFMLRNFSEFALFTWLFYFLVVSAYFVGGGAFFIIDYFDLAPKYKIQPLRKPDLGQYLRCLTRIALTYLGISVFCGFNYALRSIGFRSELSALPSLGTVVAQVLIFFFLEDIVQYFLHRWLHTPWAYKNIHKVHHQHTAPFGLTAAYAHPLEVLILAIPTYTGPMLFRPHLCTMYIWMLTRELDSVHTHCGYEFPWQRALSKFIPYYGGTQFHDYHHYAFNVNYASRLTFLDKMFGTYKEVAHVGDEQAPVDPILGTTSEKAPNPKRRKNAAS